MIAPRISAKTTFLPGKLSITSAYADSDPRNSFPNTLAAVTSAVFT